MTEPIEIGRLLRSSTLGCVVGCSVEQINAPALGELVNIPLGDGYVIYGLVNDIHIDNDGTVGHLALVPDLPDEVVMDNRMNRVVPVEVSVLFVGYSLAGQVRHLLPPRPALSLERIYTCGDAELVAFTGAGRFGYFRHVLRNELAPTGEILAAHLRQAGAAQAVAGHPEWLVAAEKELITLLRDDHTALMNVLSALSDTF